MGTTDWFSASFSFFSGFSLPFAFVYNVSAAICFSLLYALLLCAKKNQPSISRIQSNTNAPKSTTIKKTTEDVTKSNQLTAAGEEDIKGSTNEDNAKPKKRSEHKFDIKAPTKKFSKNMQSKLETGGISDISADRASAFQSMFPKPESSAECQPKKGAQVASAFGEAPPTEVEVATGMVEEEPQSHGDAKHIEQPEKKASKFPNLAKNIKQLQNTKVPPTKIRTSDNQVVSTKNKSIKQLLHTKVPLTKIRISDTQVTSIKQTANVNNTKQIKKPSSGQLLPNKHAKKIYDKFAVTQMRTLKVDKVATAMKTTPKQKNEPKLQSLFKMQKAKS